MASTDARPVPKKNLAYRLSVVLFEFGTSTRITAVTSFDSEISKDGAAYADCTNEVALVNSGLVTLDLTATEMNADTVAVRVKDASGNVLVDWIDTPEEAGDIRVNVTQISDDSTAAINAEAFFDGTGYAGTGNVIPTVTTLTGHTAQTGDSFARLGAPAGASVSADIGVIDTVVDGIQSDLSNGTDGLGAIKADTAATLLDTNELQGDWTNGGRLDLVLDATAADVVNIDGAAMRGTDGALLAASAPTNFGDLAITVTTGQVTVGTNNDKTGYTVSTVSDKTGYSLAADQSGVTIGTVTTNTDMRGTDSASTHSAADVWTAVTRTLTAGTNLNDISVADVLTTQMTEAYAAEGVAPTLAQSLFLIQQVLQEFGVSGTTLTVNKLDQTTAAATYTLDSATEPTSLTRAT